MEGVGIKPHIEIILKKEDYLKHRDVVLEYVINEVEKK
jgi:hypothetical protein